MSGYVTLEEHERIMRHNSKLENSLEEAKKAIKESRHDAEQAKEAFRKLASWAYIERRRILEALEHHGIAIQQPDGRAAVQYEASVHTKLEPPSAAEMNGADPTSVGHQRAHSTAACSTGGMKKTKADDVSDVEDGDDYTPAAADEFPSIDEQVDQLIAEEKGRLTLTN